MRTGAIPLAARGESGLMLYYTAGHGDGQTAARSTAEPGRSIADLDIADAVRSGCRAARFRMSIGVLRYSRILLNTADSILIL